jgi:hypothetical protein
MTEDSLRSQQHSCSLRAAHSSPPLKGTGIPAPVIEDRYPGEGEWLPNTLKYTYDRIASVLNTNGEFYSDHLYATVDSDDANPSRLIDQDICDAVEEVLNLQQRGIPSEWTTLDGHKHTFITYGTNVPGIIILQLQSLNFSTLKSQTFWTIKKDSQLYR